MFFDSIEKILTQLEQQPGWEKFRLHRQLLKCWDKSVSKNIAQHTRPLYVNRQVLWVATKSAARAQELSFQRYSLLKKLNQQLPFVLKDIRFSSSGWHQSEQDRSTSPEKVLFELSDRHRSQSISSISNSLNTQTQNKVSSPADAKLAAQRWLKKIEQNSASFAACPHCDAPTPLEEIKRWNLCYHCVAQKWSKEYRI